MSADLWTKRREISRRNLTRMANATNVPDFLIAEQARVFLNAFHKGSWRTIFALINYELIGLWGGYGWPKWQWFRVKVLKRKPDPVWVIAQSIAKERSEEIAERNEGND